MNEFYIQPAISNSNECLKHVVKSIFEGGNTIASDFSLDQNQGIVSHNLASCLYQIRIFL